MGVEQLHTVEDWEQYFDGFKANLAPVAYEAGPSLTVIEPAETVHPEQIAWARQMAKRIYEPVAGKVYVAVGYQLCSTTMVVGDDGVIIIDPGENDTCSAELLADFRRFSDLPIRAVVFTHRHPDHCYTLTGLGVTAADVDDGRVDIVAHESFTDWLINDAGLIGPILTARTSLVKYGGFGPNGLIHGGLGALPKPGTSSTHLPTITTGESEELTIAGVRMRVFAAYGDAQDEIDLWFPDFKHVHGSETIQGETFPNLYTLRGTAYRDVEAWYDGVDRLLEQAVEADSYSGSHMRPWVGNDFILERITNYRDAIQFLHDQSIRHINRGATGPELIPLVAQKLPAHLRDDPWLQPYYGTPEHSVRAIYDGTLGWYTGDPTELAAPLNVDRAARYVAALGGRDSVLEQSQAAIDSGEWGWAAELLTHLVRVDGDDMEARRLKAEALRRWGYVQKNMYWRALSLGAAAELDGTVDYGDTFDLQPRDVLNAIPPTKIIAGYRVRLDPEKAAAADTTIAFRFTDTGDECAIQVRRGVAVNHDDVPATADAVIELTARAAREHPGELLARDTLLRIGTITDGDAGVVERFTSYFDPMPEHPPLVAIR